MIVNIKGFLRKIFLLPLAFILSPEAAQSSEAIDETAGINRKQKASEQKGIAIIQSYLYEGKSCRLVTHLDNAFIVSHSKDIHLNPDAYTKVNDWALEPFGVYGLDVEGDIVGLHYIVPIYHGDYLVASVTTDIFKKYRSSGYGTLLRKLVATEIEKHIGKTVRIKSASGEELTRLPLSYVFSNNEWEYGKNGASTYSSLKAGYGIACISFSGLIKMLSPRNELLWGEERTDNLMCASRILGGDSSRHKEAIPYLINIINDLDLTQKADVETLNSLISFMDNRFGGDSENQRLLDKCILNLGKENRDLLINLTKGIQGQFAQKIPSDMLGIVGDLSQQVRDSLSQRLARLEAVL